MTQPSTPTKAKRKKSTTDLNKKLTNIWEKYAFQPASIYNMKDMLRDLYALKLTNVEIIIIHDIRDEVPRLRFVYDGDEYLWSKAILLKV